MLVIFYSKAREAPSRGTGAGCCCWPHSRGRRHWFSDSVPSPQRARCLCIASSLRGLSTGHGSKDKVSERTNAAVFQFRGKQQLRRAALCTALVQPGWASGLQVKPFPWVLPQAAPGPPVHFLETSGLGCCVRSLDCCCLALAIPLLCSSKICQDSVFPQEKEYGNGVMKRLSLQTSLRPRGALWRLRSPLKCWACSAT